MCGYRLRNVLLCGKILVYNELAINQKPSNITRQKMKKDTQQPKINQGGKAVLKTELEIDIIGEPSISALPESEQHIFLETLLAQLKELKENAENHN